MTQRFFRTASSEAYEQARLSLDTAWGFPNQMTQTCFEPAVTAPRDAQGRLLLAVDASFCQYAAVADMLPAMLASGAIEEITAEDYRPAEVNT